MELSTFVVLLILAAVSFLFLYKWLNKEVRRLPPCPVSPLPIFGNVREFLSDLRSKINQWRERCGDITRLQIGSKVIVLFYGYELIKEILVHRAKDFTDRPLTVIDLVADTPRCGIFSSSGKVWKEQRTVSLHILRNFGLGKGLLADKIQEELHHYIQHLSDNTGKPIDIFPMTNVSISNNICSILLGRRFEYNDQAFVKLLSNISSLGKNFNFNSCVVFLPILKYLPGDVFRTKETERGIKEIFQLFDEYIEKCQRGESLECFLTEYLKEQKQREQSGITTTMNERNLKMVFFDLFAAGSETTSTTIDWFVLYMLHHPDVQKKIFDEINEHVGTERVPDMQDKQNLTYVNAAIMETQRLASIVPNSVPHTCLSDMQVRGYTIPKDAYILPCLDSVLHDSQIWGHDVMAFKPERFINQDGKLQIPEEFIPFSIGNRTCLGENMAKTSLFLYISNMIQKFEFQPAVLGQPPPLKHISGFVISPERYHVKIIARSI